MEYTTDRYKPKAALQKPKKSIAEVAYVSGRVERVVFDLGRDGKHTPGFDKAVDAMRALPTVTGVKISRG